MFDRVVMPESHFASKKLKAEGIIEALRAMQYSAIGIAPHDLTVGTEFLEHLQSTYNIPFVSINLVSKSSGKRLFKPYVTTQRGDTSIAILGLTDISPVSTKNKLLENINALPWQDTLKKTLSEIQDKADLIILLSSFPEKTNKEIAKQFDNINIILQSGYSSSNRRIMLIENALIGQTASRGKYVGKIDINWTKAKKWRNPNQTGKEAGLKNRLDKVNGRINRLENNIENQNIKEDKHYQDLLQARAEIQEELKKINLKQQPYEELSTYRTRLFGIYKPLPEDPEVKAILHKNKKGVQSANKQRLTKKIQNNVQNSLQQSMAGWKSCKPCHALQTENWQTSNHAKAWETLATKKQQFNPECLICHVTLPTYNKESVTRNNLIATLTPEFHNVGCESCHGPGKKHTKSPQEYDLITPTEEVCTMCHKPDHDDNFDYKSKVKLLNCTKG